MVRLESYHINAHDLRIDHAKAALDEGPPRLLGFHWWDETGWMELSLEQIEDIRYKGVLNYFDQGWEHPVHAEVSWNMEEQRWEIKVSSHYVDQPLVIFAMKK